MSTTKKVIIIILALLPVIGTALIYSTLPEQIPTHWNVDGTVTYGPRATILMLGGLNVFFAVFMPLMPKIDPRKNNYASFQKHYDTFVIIIELFGLVMWAMVVSESLLPGRISVGRVTNIGIALLFVFLGNMMPKFKNNFFVGIKNPWTLSDPEVWNKAQRLSGFLFVIAGTAQLICGFLLQEKALFWMMMAFVMVITTVPTLMSYLWYRRRNAG